MAPDLLTSARAAARAAWDASPRLLIGYLVVMAAQGLAPVSVAWLTKLVIDDLAGSGATARLAPLAAGLAVAGLATAALPQLASYTGRELGRRFTVRATERLFAATTERFLGLARFEDPRFLDRMRLAQQSAGAGEGLVSGFFTLAQAAITLVGFVGSLLVLSPVMTLIVLAAGAPSLAVQVRLSRRRAELAMEMGPAERRQFFYGNLLSSVAAAKEVRLFGSGGFLRGRLLGELGQVNAAERRMDLRELASEGGLSLLGAAVAGGGLVWAILSAGAGALTVGDVSLFVVGVASVQGALNALVGSFGSTHQNLLMFGHHAAVLTAEPDLPVPAEPVATGPLEHGVELRDVWFRYSDEHPWILRGVSLRIPRGASVALVGLNGAGKSTLVKLLCRFYDPTRGSILWDGVDLREMDPAALRERISAVFQDHMHYDLSAADNVAIGDLSALGAEDRIREAAGLAGVHETLAALPRGYETLLTRTFFSEEDREDPETGVVLSGGQWQRVALARAFLRRGRDLMILDEPSSGLDPEAEAEVHARTRAQREGATSLLISHRLNTVRDADLIVVLRDGVVAERGRHDDLMAADGDYARLFRLQSAGYQEAAR
ncbi:ABC transporter ATP-binding protein [Bailinhaonella thermotolerans]|uniref:ABC transporter ATP-binding protein n=1 Tax=Bailinhaonella thermotolerans TaxID=1070861 RepID=A0A3A4BNI0_9ACTN|nr:ABC transporter ATP-binding protein [Bailinhaonella thermotolerans]RJL32604.1 ABC transporter ATP-binding protein [Bailinhaonella thermotolerans]